MPDERIRDAASKFLTAFEVVFDSDWDYTKAQLGIDTAASAEAEAKLLAIFGEEPRPPRRGDETFLKPDDDDLEIQNWGNYELLLRTYAALKKALDSLPS